MSKSIQYQALVEPVFVPPVSSLLPLSWMQPFSVPTVQRGPASRQEIVQPVLPLPNVPFLDWATGPAVAPKTQPPKDGGYFVEPIHRSLVPMDWLNPAVDVPAKRARSDGYCVEPIQAMPPLAWINQPVLPDAPRRLGGEWIVEPIKPLPVSVDWLAPPADLPAKPAPRVEVTVVAPLLEIAPPVVPPLDWLVQHPYAVRVTHPMEYFVEPLLPIIPPAGSIRVAAVESRPGIRVRDMVVSTISIQGFDATPDGINVGNVEVIP